MNSFTTLQLVHQLRRLGRKTKPSRQTDYLIEKIQAHLRAIADKAMKEVA
jgi:hypothetical protein